MPKAKAPKKSGSIMSYFEPVKLPRKLAKLENQDQTTRSAAAAKKTKLKPTPQDEIPSHCVELGIDRHSFENSIQGRKYPSSASKAGCCCV